MNLVVLYFNRDKHTRVRTCAECDHLVDNDAERPNVRFDSECIAFSRGEVLREALRSRPLLREARVICLVGLKRFVSIGVCERAREAEVGELHQVLLAHQNVGGTQVAVDAALLLEELHPVRYLREDTQ